MKLSRAVLIVTSSMLLLLGACSSGDTDPTGPVGGNVEILAEADQLAFSYVVSGGIAGQTNLELVVNGDGTGTVIVTEGEPQNVLVAPSVLASLIAELERLGIHDIDTTKQPETQLADGFSVGIRVHSVNGTSDVGWYGIFEVPDVFDADMVAMAERAAAFAAPLAAPLPGGETLEGNRAAVLGAFFVEGGVARLCEALMESFPPQCGGAATTLIGFDPALVQLEAAESIRWSDDFWIVYGRVTENGLDVS